MKTFSDAAMNLALRMRLGEPSSGVEAGVVRLLDDCGVSLRRYLHSFALTSEETEDVFQDVLLALTRHLEQGRPETNIKGWVFRVAHNLALRQRAKTRRFLSRHVEDLAEAWQVLDVSPTPEERLAGAERRAAVQRVWRQLPDRDRRCLFLRAEGLVYREIARALNMSLGAVSNSLARSLEVLAQAGEPSGGQE